MRLIDADELPEVNTIERIDGEREVFVNSWIPAAAIWKAPTVDAVPVVRCKDCKYLNIINKAPVYACCSKHNHTFHLWEDDTREHFCSWGERKCD